MRVSLFCLRIALAGVALLAGFARSGQAQSLRAGAAKVDVTPAESEMPKNYLGVLDRIYTRAIVIDNGKTKAALVEVPGNCGTQDWEAATKRAEAELGIPQKQIIIGGTHSHSVPRGKALADKIFEALKTANSKLQPARMGYGTGVSYINVNRNIIDPKTRKWWEGANYDGPSDKTVAVIKFETPNGDPIAVYYNYACHAVTVGTLDLVSGDFPGTTSKYIEESLGGDTVALWSSGAEGDQNPIFFQQTYDLREIRVKDYAKKGQDISNSMPPGGTGLDRNDPKTALLMNQQKQMILTYGQMLGEEVLRVVRFGIPRMETATRIYGDAKNFSCPGRQRINQGRAGEPGEYKDADPVGARLSLVMIGDIALGGVAGEVFNPIGTRFKKESPYRSMMVTVANGGGNTGYIPNDAAFGYNTFEVLSSRLKPGCAESAIVDGLIDLMPKD
jgi:neutral ceramidase